DEGEGGQARGDVRLDLDERPLEAGQADRERARLSHQDTASRCSIEKVPSSWACTATTSIRTSRCGVERSMRYSPASRRRRRSLSGVTAAWGTPVTKERRVLTSTKTSVAWSSATMSSSPCRSRRLRSTICQPCALRCEAASPSPARPSCAVVMSRTRPGGGGAGGPSAGRAAAAPGTRWGPGAAARVFMPASLVSAQPPGNRAGDPGDGGPLWRRGRGALSAATGRSRQGDVLLVELLDVHVLEGHHAHRAHETVGAVAEV